jgi:hypothetical protein
MKKKERKKVRNQKKESKPPYSRERLSHFQRKQRSWRSNPSAASWPSMEKVVYVSREMEWVRKSLASLQRPNVLN